TADHALEASRDVFVVPGSIFAPECRGSNRLLRQGALPITDVSELAQAMAAVLGEPRVPPTMPVLIQSDVLVRALTADPMRPDDVARAFSVDIVTAMRRIGALEAAGRIQRYPDGRYGAVPSTSSKEQEKRGGEDTIGETPQPQE
ncbi:MAG: hypothetical protein HY876_01915, partial [Coriobacteriales bacterium]|nr:hypothetical protein [Coriobacteriales bacterium]